MFRLLISERIFNKNLLKLVSQITEKNRNGVLAVKSIQMVLITLLEDVSFNHHPKSVKI